MESALQQTKRVYGGSESQVVVGAGLYTVAGNMRGYAITVRVTGTIIAAINVQDEGGVSRPYVPTFAGIILYAGESFVSQFPIVDITLTAATDSITLHCDRPY
jgi:hypothetical protein